MKVLQELEAIYQSFKNEEQARNIQVTNTGLQGVLLSRGNGKHTVIFVDIVKTEKGYTSMYSLYSDLPKKDFKIKVAEDEHSEETTQHIIKTISEYV